MSALPLPWFVFLPNATAIPISIEVPFILQPLTHHRRTMSYKDDGTLGWLNSAKCMLKVCPDITGIPS